MNADPNSKPDQNHDPITSFTDCHSDIVGHLNALEQLESLLAAATRARAIAREAVAFFDDMIFNHHEEEERDLFPTVRKAAAAGPERDEVIALSDRLIADHRLLEGQWKKIKPQLERIAAGKGEALDIETVSRLVAGYKAHAHFEETRFLPLSEKILGRQSAELAGLGYSLHIRRAQKKTLPFI